MMSPPEQVFKSIQIIHGDLPVDIYIDNMKLRNTGNFDYLGNMISDTNEAEKDINHCLQAASIAFG